MSGGPSAGVMLHRYWRLFHACLRRASADSNARGPMPLRGSSTTFRIAYEYGTVLGRNDWSVGSGQGDDGLALAGSGGGGGQRRRGRRPVGRAGGQGRRPDELRLEVVERGVELVDGVVAALGIRGVREG